MKIFEKDGRMWTNGYLTDGTQVNQQVRLVQDIAQEAWEPTQNPDVQFVELAELTPECLEIVEEKVTYPATLDKNGKAIFPASVRKVKVLVIDTSALNTNVKADKKSA